MKTNLQNTDHQQQDVKPRLGEEHELLKSFVGKWHIEGRNAGDDLTEVTGEECYEMMPGDFFLTYRWKRNFGETEHVGIGVIGAETTGPKYFANFFDNLGYARFYEAKVGEATLTLLGKWERATIEIGGGGQTMMINWEQSKDGKAWRPLCSLIGTKIH